MIDIEFQSGSIEEYLQKVICNNRIPKREKIPILLAYTEPLFYKAVGKRKEAHDRIKKVVEDKAKEQHDLNIESFNIVLTFALANVVFSNTDSYEQPIDHSMPFRNNILHNGLLEYSDRDIKLVYDRLTIIIAILIMIIGDYDAAKQDEVTH